MKNKKAIIFDFDGTLSDTVGAIAEAVNLTMEYFGFDKKRCCKMLPKMLY